MALSSPQKAFLFNVLSIPVGLFVIGLLVWILSFWPAREPAQDFGELGAGLFLFIVGSVFLIIFFVLWGFKVVSDLKKHRTHRWFVISHILLIVLLLLPFLDVGGGLAYKHIKWNYEASKITQTIATYETIKFGSNMSIFAFEIQNDSAILYMRCTDNVYPSSRYKRLEKWNTGVDRQMWVHELKVYTVEGQGLKALPYFKPDTVSGPNSVLLKTKRVSDRNEYHYDISTKELNIYRRYRMNNDIKINGLELNSSDVMGFWEDKDGTQFICLDSRDGNFLYKINLLKIDANKKFKVYEFSLKKEDIEEGFWGMYKHGNRIYLIGKKVICFELI